MRKILILLTILFLSACGNGASSSLEDFDNSSLKKDIKEADFQPELPTKTPFEVESATFNPGPEGQEDLRQNFNFYGVDGEYMDLIAYSGDVNFSGIENSEKVKIGDNEGTFGETENGALSLHWKDGDLTYNLLAKSEEVTKEELIEMASSFK